MSTHKNQWNLKSRNEKIETNCQFDVFKKCTAHFSLLIAHFMGKPNEALLVLKDLQPSRADKASRPWLGILQKNKKTGLAIFRKKKRLGWSYGTHKRKGWLDRLECPAQPS